MVKLPTGAIVIDPATLEAVAHRMHHDPHSVLGAHPALGTITVRTLRPLAKAVTVLAGADRFPMIHECEGIWVAVLPLAKMPDYRLQVDYSTSSIVDEPYRFLPTLGEVDLHLIGEGRHEQLWNVLGAHVRHFAGPLGAVDGASFAVWAPNARAVRVVGDFNNWTGHAMRSLGSSGVWEIFIPGIGAGNAYKFEIRGKDGSWHQKADPMARAATVPPDTASVVTASSHVWQDEAWITARARRDPANSPMSIYEVHLGSWRQGLSYRDLADQLVGYVRDLGFTHVELMPVMEHPFGASWGYQVTGYFAPTSRFGAPDDFRYLVDALHQAGIGVLLDWVPGHFPRDDWALAHFDGQTLYECADPRRGEDPDWGTLVFDVGRPQVRNFLVANAVYWLEEFHIDGLRVDAVASMLYHDYSRAPGQWVANVYGGRENLEAIKFLQEMNATAYKRVPGIITIAEESTAWAGVTQSTKTGGLGFGLKWNMGWMHDTLGYINHEPVHRRYHHNELTFSLIYAFSENYVLPISHDEVVHGKGSLLGRIPGDRWQQLATLRAYLAFMWSHPGKKLLFMSTELGQESEWAESRSIDWWLEKDPRHAGVQRLIRDLNALYRKTPALWEREQNPGCFEWLDSDNAAHDLLAFIRWGRDGTPLIAVVSFSGTPLEDYRLPLPHAGTWCEVLNTDAKCYCGSGVGNDGLIQASHGPWYGRPASARIRVPPLGALWLTSQG
jgi:1,4-alpha-glucan branching enzyme